MLVLINAVGLTQRWLEHAPRLSALANAGWVRSLREVTPAVTSTAQATILTGKRPDEHGVVANGWLFRDTMEVRFWQQSNRLLGAEPLYARLRRERPDFRCAQLFWWFNQGADVAYSVTPKPWYGADGNKVFDIAGAPDGYAERMKQHLGPFPFASFWGPMAGLPATTWIAKCAAEAIQRDQPDLTLVYLPHLDYDPQRFGPSRCDMAGCVRALDSACEPILDASAKTGARVWIVSEYGHSDVDFGAVGFPNRVLRQAGLAVVRHGPFGEILDTFESKAFAVCDHQLAHVYVREPSAVRWVGELMASEPSVARVLIGEERKEFGLDHPRSGEIVLLSQPKAWFAYPYWLRDDRAPDFARTVDIHRKIGFDPCEMFFDARLRLPKWRAARRLLQKKLGFRTRFDLIGLDASVVGGTHGLPAADPLDRPILIGNGPPPAADLGLCDVHDVLHAAISR